ncbi:copper-binding protein [Rhodocyclaceae bacterium SMB388]
MRTLSSTSLPRFVVASIALAGLVGLSAGQVMAQAGHAGSHGGHGAAAASAGATESAEAAATGLSEGTVRRVNAGAGTVTIAHGPLVNLDMPPMTMTFRVSGDASLDGLTNGDKIRFAADKDGDEFIVTAIEKRGD